MFRPSTLLLLAALACAGCTRAPPPATVAAPPPAADAERRLATGRVVGFANPSGGHTWLGLPYAAPPVGALRWRAPQPPAPWPGTRDALRAGAPCIQYGWALGGMGPDGSHQGSEDCLTLNVYAPRLPPAASATARLPVMVWVHGGANTVGQGASYDGALLASSQRVVVVTINYRLGPFGWFVMPRGADATRPAEDALDASGNFGLLDLLASLRWVHAEIGAFGGDPGNVTVFGESAGATNTLALLVTPLSAGLVQRVIIESLGFGLAPLARVTHYTDDPDPGGVYSSGEILLKGLVRAGRATDRASAQAVAARMSGAETAALLRAFDPWALYGLYHPSNIETDLFPTVFQDGSVIRSGAVEELLADPARHLAIPTLLGTNRDEPKLFMAFDPRLVRKLAGAPLWIKDADAYEREASYRALLWRANGVDRPAAALAAAGTPAFAYRWDWREEGRRYGFLDASRLFGAAHGLETSFVFGAFDTTPGHGLLFTDQNLAGRVSLSEAMMSYWAQFAATGRPGRGRNGMLPEWPAWSSAAGGAPFLVLDTAAHGGLRVERATASREAVIARMEAAEPTISAACAMFRATFRSRVDPWADAAWQSFRGGDCARRFPAGRFAP